MQDAVRKRRFEIGPLVLRFPHPVLAEDPVTGLQRGGGAFRRVGFRHRDQRNVFGIAPDVGRRRGNFRADIGQVRRNIGNRICVRSHRPGRAGHSRGRENGARPREACLIFLRRFAPAYGHEKGAAEAAPSIVRYRSGLRSEPVSRWSAPRRRSSRKVWRLSRRRHNRPRSR